MGLTTYKATGVFMTALKRLLGVNLRATGSEHLVDRPTLFVANHFTRIETFLIPYVIFRQARRQVRSLGTHSVFRGLFGDYFEALGGMSTRDPRRNRTIVRELMTGRSDWVIYPEGGLIKNKKMVHKGRLRLSHPERQGPPHTGAAMLALKAVMCKHRYLAACEEDDLRRIEYYEDSFGLNGTDQICTDGIVIVPVTLTFYPMRPSRNLVNRLAKFVTHDLDSRIDEELQVEGSILLTGSEICVHFGAPIEVVDYLGKVSSLARRVVGMFSEAGRTELFLRQQAKRLTEVCMREIYNNTEVNFDHLFCHGLRVFEGERIAVEDLRSALFLAAVEFAARDGVRVHRTLVDGIASLVTGESFEPWDSAVRLAKKEGILRLEDGACVVNRAVLQADHEFHDIRLEKMVQVIANELEPIEPAVTTLRRLVNLSSSQLRAKTLEVLQRQDAELYGRDYEQAFRPELSKPKEVGEPFFLESRDRTVGVVLAHGYLASPEQVRPLAEYLNGEGISVYAVRLKGHGTAPHQLTNVRWQDWMDCVMHGYALIRQHAEKVVAGGFSLGGTLALLLAARRAGGIDGIFSINAPVKLRDRRAPLVPAIVQWNGALRHLGLSDGYYHRLNDDTESPDINYGVDYLTGIRELRRAADACRKRLRDVTAPALIIQSDGDPLIGSESGRALLNRLGSKDKVLSELAFDRHVIIRGDDSETVFETIGRFVRRVAEEGTEGLRGRGARD
ncbi:MAG: alpha/beta fold hydrolase [Planctomycetota bacterium]|jgi:esterase/lipase/1-acyl-sn-glycerol-3-phosphate acyltransferase